MPNIKSAIKRVKVTETKNLRNRIVKSKVKTAVKKFETEATAAQYSLTTSAIDKADGAYKVAVKKVDQAAAKGILHKNTANRKKARLAKMVNA